MIKIFNQSSKWRFLSFYVCSTHDVGIRKPYKLFSRKNWQSHDPGCSLEQNSGIFALSSGFGKCGVAVIRISGKGARNALLSLGRKTQLPPEKTASLWNLYHPKTRVQLDRGLVLWFKGPGSFTGEDVCELHVHGGPAVVSSVLDALSSLPDLRPAEAGEFTKRAFQNGKLDLTEVEGLGDLIHAETEAQRRQALQQMQGSLSSLYGGWRTALIKCVANAEAYIDFSEEDNIEDGVLQQVNESIDVLREELTCHLHDNRRGERLRSGVRVAIIGEPNVGKSSLLNAITQRETAIVSPIAGTTRDVIETAVDFGGFPVLLSDTAGLRESDDVIEKEGVKRALQRANDSDVKILVFESKDIVQAAASVTFQLTSYVANHLTELGVVAAKSGTVDEAGVGRLSSDDVWGPYHVGSDDVLVILNKCDLIEDKNFLQECMKKCRNIQDNIEHNVCSSQSSDRFKKAELQLDGSSDTPHQGLGCRGSRDLVVCAVSCTTGEGMDGFLALLKNKLQSLCVSTEMGNPSLTQARHRAHLNKCLHHMRCYDNLKDRDIVLATEQLRQASRQIGKVTGKITSEEILDVVFKDFCIGK